MTEPHATAKLLISGHANHLPGDVRPFVVCARILLYLAVVGGLLNVLAVLHMPWPWAAVVAFNMAVAGAATAWHTGWWPKP